MDETLSVSPPSEAPAAPEARTRRDLQRGALQDLVALVSECAAREAEIGSRSTADLAAAAASQVRVRQDLDRNYRALQEQIVQKQEERAGQIESRFTQSRAAIKSKAQGAVQRARRDFDTLQNDVKAKYKQAVWLSESVLEATEEKLAVALKRARDLHATQGEAIDAKDKELQTLLFRYSENRPISPDALATLQAEEATAADPAASYTAHVETIDANLKELDNLRLPGLFIGGRAPMIILVLVVLAAAAPLGISKSLDFQSQWKPMCIWAGAMLLVCIFLHVWLRSKARQHVVATTLPILRGLDAARIAAENTLQRSIKKYEEDSAAARKQQKTEAQAARDKATPLLDNAAKQRDAALHAAQAEMEARSAETDAQHTAAKDELAQWHTRKVEETEQRYVAEQQNIVRRAENRQVELKQQHADQRAALEKHWIDGLTRIQHPIQQQGGTNVPWNDPSWQNFVPPKTFPESVRFGELQINLKSIVAETVPDALFTLPCPDTFAMPALLAFPKQASMLIHTDRAGRLEAIQAIQMLMTRLLTTLPPGRVRFTLIDPVGLGQNFAGFMHLADHDEALVTSRIWTDSDQIDQRLTNLTEHMETVIQKYLRNEFATIDDYNAQAGELAEPYRYLIIADLPVNFSDDAFRRLSSIANSGARCGVYTIIMRDTRINSQGIGAALDDLEAHSVNLIRQNERFIWRDDVFKRFPLVLDTPPNEDELTHILHTVGKLAKEAKRVEVPFENIAPHPAQFWTLHSSKDLSVAIGRSGATRLQQFALGRGVAQHALVAGKTGSGKSTMLHALIANLAMWYSPDEVELYLIDFKKGVEFKTYATHNLPHARAIAVESDREFGLSVLQRIDAEMSRRGDLYRKFGVQGLADYRDASGETMPRTLLVIDEFQEFFTEDDKLAQDAALYLDRLVRQGRAFGVHVLLGSQTIGGSSGLSRSTIGQIAVRIALQTTDADSQIILGDGNSAARLLSRPGEAIYNDAGGLVEGNSPFQVAWLPDEKRDVYLEAVNKKLVDTNTKTTLPIVFEGNAPAEYQKNQPLADLLAAPAYIQTSAPPQLWVGDPVAIKPATTVPLRRQSGANVLIIGQNEESAMAMVAIGMIGLAAQLSPAASSFYLFDGTPTDSLGFGFLPSVAAALPHTTKIVEYRAVPEAIHELTLELQRRQSSDTATPPPIFIILFGMQRFRAIRKTEESFSSFGNSGDDAEKPPDTGKEFADLLRNGSTFGIHLIAWIDTATALDRTLERGSLREMDSRVLFQMSANDSSALIDSPAGNKLGNNRALVYSEEQGSMEKFRPYAVPDKQWLEEVKSKLAAKAKSAK